MAGRDRSGTRDRPARVRLDPAGRHRPDGDAGLRQLERERDRAQSTPRSPEAGASRDQLLARGPAERVAGRRQAQRQAVAALTAAPGVQACRPRSRRLGPTPVGSCCSSRTRLSRANASTSLMRGTIRLPARSRRSAFVSVRSPRTTASMSVVIRRTPRAMIAMPPITIHGIPDASSAFAKAASASSIRRSPAARLLRTTLHQCPSAPDSLNALLAARVAGSRPQAHGLERVQRGQRLGHGLRRSGAFGRLQAALAVRGQFMASLPAPNPALSGVRQHAKALLDSVVVGHDRRAYARAHSAIESATSLRSVVVEEFDDAPADGTHGEATCAVATCCRHSPFLLDNE